MAKIIDLEKCATKGVGVLAGRGRGEAIRLQEDLDDSDRNRTSVEVIVPSFIYSINSSFFLGLFGDSIRNLGEDEFNRLFTFRGRDITQFVQDGIRQALRTTSPLRNRGRVKAPTAA